MIKCVYFTILGYRYVTYIIMLVATYRGDSPTCVDTYFFLRMTLEIS